jgi:hypothetical protein
MRAGETTRFQDYFWAEAHQKLLWNPRSGWPVDSSTAAVRWFVFEGCPAGSAWTLKPGLENKKIGEKS